MRNGKTMLEKIKKYRWHLLGAGIFALIVLYLVLRATGVIPNYKTLIGLLDEIGILLGIFGFFVSLYTFVNTKTLLDKRKQYISRPKIGSDDVVLNISIGDDKEGKIKSNVTNYIEKNKEQKPFKELLDGEDFKYTENLKTEWEKNKIMNKFEIEYGFNNKINGKDGRMVSIHRGNVENTSENFQKVKDELYQVLTVFNNQMTGENSINKVHLFYSGPLVYGAVIGNFFSNQNQIELYHFVGGGYIYAGNLSQYNDDEQRELQDKNVKTENENENV